MARVLVSMKIAPLYQVPPGLIGEADPTCDRSFPCTRMWKQTSSRRASPDSILSCGHRNVQAVTEASTRVQWLLPSASSIPL